jgi:hypothetical protein
LPLPLAPLVIVIQDAVVVAVQAQPVVAVTATVPVAPAATTFVDAGAIVGAHATPAWMTVKVLPPTVREPVREVPSGFAATV